MHSICLEAHRKLYCKVGDARPVRRQANGYLPTVSEHHNQVILLGGRGICA